MSSQQLEDIPRAPSSRALKKKNQFYIHRWLRRARLNVRYLQVIKMLICVVILFLCCWGPRFVMEFLLKLPIRGKFSSFVYWTKIAVVLLPFVHAVLNPVIYLMLSKNIRSSVAKQVMVSNKCILDNYLPSNE